MDNRPEPVDEGERTYIGSSVGFLDGSGAAALPAEEELEAIRFDLVNPAPVSVQGLTKRYGSITAISDLTFDVHPGTVTGFLGPNGAGKTTTLRAILGLIRPSEGTAAVFGLPYRVLKEPTRQVGALLETTQFHPLRTGRNHLRVLAAQSGIASRRVDEVLEMVRMSEAAGRKVGGYSLGMRQRLGLAAALLGDPRILLLDEPANGLDPSGIRWLREFLRDFAHRDRTVFVSSHLLSEMATLADEVVVIAKGRLVVQTSIHKLTEERSQLVTVRTPEPGRLASVLANEGWHAAVTGPELVVVDDARVERVGAAASRAGVVLYGLETERQSLEEIFLQLTGEPEVKR